MLFAFNQLVGYPFLTTVTKRDSSLEDSPRFHSQTGT